MSKRQEKAPATEAMPEPSVSIPVSVAAKLVQVGRIADPTGAFIGPQLQQIQQDIQRALIVRRAKG